MHRRTILGFAAALGASVLACSPALAQPKEKVTLMLNWYTTGLHAPFYLGKEKGYFEQEGIDLVIQEGRGSGPTVQAVAGKSVTLGFVDIGTMMKIVAKGAPVKAVAVALQKNPISVISLAEKNITKPQDIKGKIVATTAGDSPSQIWPLFLKKNNLSESDFRTVSGDAQTKVKAVLNGQADMLIGFSTDQNNELERLTNKPVNTMLFADYGVGMASSSIIARNDLIKENPALLKRFLRAATKAFEETEKNPEAAVDAVLKAAPKAGTKESLSKGLASSIALFHADGEKGPPLKVSQKTMDETVQMMIASGGIPASAGNAAVYYTNELLP